MFCCFVIFCSRCQIKGVFYPGVNEEEQLSALDAMEKLVQKMKFHSKKDRSKLVNIKFQTGIIVSIKSTKDLYIEVKSEGLEYLLTAKTNQDALENVFSQLRLMGGANAHPTSVQCMNRIRKLCMVKNIDLVVRDANVEYTDEVNIMRTNSAYLSQSSE